MYVSTSANFTHIICINNNSAHNVEWKILFAFPEEIQYSIFSNKIFKFIEIQQVCIFFRYVYMSANKNKNN